MRTTRTLFPLLGLLLIACGAPPPAAPTTPKSAALLTSVGGKMLAPLVCWDDEMSGFRAGLNCLDIMGGTMKLRLGSGGALPGRVMPHVSAGCGVDRAVQIAANSPSAVWPDDARPQLVPAPPPTRPRVDPTRLGRIEAAMKQAAPGLEGELEIYQVFAIDLDGDTLADSVYSVFVRAPTGAPMEFILSGLIINPGRSVEYYRALQVSTDDRYLLKGAIDLNGNGQRELWVEAETFGGGLVVKRNEIFWRDVAGLNPTIVAQREACR